MAPRQSTPESADDDAPETLSFGSSKKAAQGARDAVQQAQRAEQLKRKQHNRERDAALKRRAELAKEHPGESVSPRKRQKIAQKARIEELSDASGEDGDGARDDLEARMERAMHEAEEESDDDELDVDEVHIARAENGAGPGEHEDEEMLTDEEESESELEDDDTPPPDLAKSKYLPDHLFKAAFARLSLPSKSPKTFTPKATTSKPPTKKRRRAKRPSKDIIIGSKTIRTLPSPSDPLPAASRSLMPPPRTNKFLNRSLNVKGRPALAKAKGWERRPANLGVLRRNGPAASFVRS